jgi:hypothetical protein
LPPPPPPRPNTHLLLRSRLSCRRSTQGNLCSRKQWVLTQHWSSVHKMDHACSIWFSAFVTCEAMGRLHCLQITGLQSSLYLLAAPLAGLGLSLSSQHSSRSTGGLQVSCESIQGLTSPLLPFLTQPVLPLRVLKFIWRRGSLPLSVSQSSKSSMVSHSQSLHLSLVDSPPSFSPCFLLCPSCSSCKDLFLF